MFDEIALQDRMDPVPQSGALLDQGLSMRHLAPQRPRGGVRDPHGGIKSAASSWAKMALSIRSVFTLALAIARVRMGLDTTTRPACALSNSAMGQVFMLASSTT